MKRRIIDNSTFPERKVISVKVLREDHVAGLSHMLTLECGHTVGVTKGRAVPESVKCYRCSKGE